MPLWLRLLLPVKVGVTVFAVGAVLDGADFAADDWRRFLGSGVVLAGVFVAIVVGLPVGLPLYAVDWVKHTYTPAVLLGSPVGRR
jgi:ABC-type nitrate/sulfonate/bicarbonate transport system permease component